MYKYKNIFLLCMIKQPWERINSFVVIKYILLSSYSGPKTPAPNLLSICYKIQFVPDTVCARYNLCPIQFVPDTICVWYKLCRYKLCRYNLCQYNLFPIQFVPIQFVHEPFKSILFSLNTISLQFNLHYNLCHLTANSLYPCVTDKK